MSLDSKLNIYLKSSAVKPSKVFRPRPPRIGYLRQTPLGEIWIVDWQYEQGQIHGGHEIKKLSRLHYLLDSKLGKFNPSKATVIDTETTGLAGGTGTYAFIIGAGFWQGEKFIIRQYMMRDFNEEPAQLTALAEDFSGSAISFNGKCFDLPLLTNRYRIHRFEPPFDNAPHLDMLFPSRRIWKRNSPGFKLTQLEEQILGYARDGDVPSYLIPSIFFDYLQSRDETLLYPILNHNRDDVLSLYQLVAIASAVISQCLENDNNDDDLLLSLAEIFFNRGEYEQAIRIIDKIKSKYASSATVNQAIRLKAFSHKKLGMWEKAIEYFLNLYDKEPDIGTATEIAKLYEHKIKNLQKALEIVARAESILEFAAIVRPEAVLGNDLTIRKKRLLLKVSRMLHT